MPSEQLSHLWYSGPNSHWQHCCVKLLTNLVSKITQQFHKVKEKNPLLHVPSARGHKNKNDSITGIELSFDDNGTDQLCMESRPSPPDRAISAGMTHKELPYNSRKVSLALWTKEKCVKRSHKKVTLNDAHTNLYVDYHVLTQVTYEDC